MTSFISHPKTSLPTTHAKKRNNVMMASQLKINKFYTDAKKVKIATSVAIHAADL